MQVTLGVDDDPFPKLIGPDFGDSVVAATHAFGAVLAINSNLARLPAERCCTLRIRDHVVSAPEGFAARGVLEDLASIVVTDFRASARNCFMHPLLQKQLAVPFILAQSDDLFEWVLTPQKAE